MAKDSLLNPVGKLCVFLSAGFCGKAACLPFVSIEFPRGLPQSYDKLSLPTSEKATKRPKATKKAAIRLNCSPFM